MSAPRPRRLAVVQVTRHRPENEAYNALVQVLNGRVWAMAGDAGWDVVRVAAADVGVHALLDATADADAVVIMGGEDVSPELYGGSTGYPGESTHFPSADDGQIALVTRALHRGTPLLGICRGAQIINVALGGTLHQHLEAGDLHRNVGVPITEVMHDHDVEIDPASTLAAALGTSTTVRSAHHQAIDRLGSGLSVVATAPDGVIEAVEHDTADILGVQWHPEDAQSPAEQLPALLDVLARALAAGAEYELAAATAPAARSDAAAA
ncbi:gamma-glutamyl-gamma-aminobutyrate hydrolase family protein [Planctomonas psychrotolerans]|uniref:gamma-glutamyl-gamma-aminobutyrate hydrolase family protein n=1 Tax=Planctomonas psychrotolerans TaxID=2528712 RepID=UPI00123BD21A|nr:gamma-glutamyl-gamma-aminobutyrate hydrolase family protein [Planctomonas psychrotolerans]